MEDALAATRTAGLCFYPLMVHGTRRFDKVAEVHFGALDQLGPESVSMEAPPQLQRVLAVADGVVEEYGEPGGRTPVVLAGFPVARGSVPDEADIQVYCVSQHQDSTGVGSPGVLELYNFQRQCWERFRRPASGVPEAGCDFLSEFRLRCTPASHYLGLSHQFVVRHYAPDAVGGKLRLDHMLLVGQWPLTQGDSGR
jgi:hypothetical protein